MSIVQIVVPYSIRDAMERGGQKARGLLIWHLKCKTQVIRQYRAQAVKDAPREQAKGCTLENPQALDLLYIRFGGLPQMVAAVTLPRARFRQPSVGCGR